MKKYVLIILLGVISQMTYPQINTKFEGCWLPQKYVDSFIEKSFTDSSDFLFPIEGIIISKEEVSNFLKYYSILINPDCVLLIQSYKSEIKTLQYENLGDDKYLLVDFYKSLNLKYISKSVVESYRETELILSMKDDKLLLEINNGHSIEFIHFINGIDNYKFKNINSAKEYLQRYKK